jgi:hypothetical protein
VLCLGAAILSIWWAVRAPAYPEPAIVSRSWEFEFTHGTPRPIAIQAADKKMQWYWFMTYKVVNKTGQERLFIPEFTIATDQGDILTAGKDVPPAVFNVVQERLGNKLLERPSQVVGKVLQGEENAKESVAIWPDFGHDVTMMTVFAGGMSGETQAIPHPKTQEPVLVSKTLMLDFDLPGYPPTPQSQTVEFKNKTWVMR